MAATKRDHFETAGGSGFVYETRDVCVNFVTSEAYSAEYAVIKGKRQGTWTSMTVALYEVDGNGRPTGAALASKTLPGSSISISEVETTFTFDTPYVVSSGVQYSIVASTVGSTQSPPEFYNWYTGGGLRRGLKLESNSVWYMTESQGHWFQVWGSEPTRQITLSSPTDEGTGILLQPLLQWSISGVGAIEGDLLDIYLRKDDANFTGDDLLVGLVDATLNSSLQIVAGLEYNATYYWQVQAFASEEDDLLSSSVFSFTVQSFSPPAYSVHPISGLPTGESNQITVRRLVAIANNKFWYEDI